MYYVVQTKVKNAFVEQMSVENEHKNSAKQPVAESKRKP